MSADLNHSRVKAQLIIRLAEALADRRLEYESKKNYHSGRIHAMQSTIIFLYPEDEGYAMCDAADARVDKVVERRKFNQRRNIKAGVCPRCGEPLHRFSWAQGDALKCSGGCGIEFVDIY